MPDAYYRTGQAARELNASAHQIRKLCRTALIEAEQTAGGQFRIPCKEIERLKKDGLPPMPVEAAPDEPSRRPSSGTAQLLAPPSEEAVRDVEEVLVAENRVKKLGLAKEAEQLKDFFREREEAESEARVQALAAEIQADIERGPLLSG